MWHSCLKKSPCFLDFVTAKTSPDKMPKYFTRWKGPKHFWSFRVKTLTIQRLTKLVFKRTNPFATFLFRFLNNSVATFIRKTKHFLYTWASEGGQGELPPRILKILAKKVVFLVSSGKKQILPLLDPATKILEKFPSAPPGKNPSHAHAFIQWTTTFYPLTGCSSLLWKNCLCSINYYPLTFVRGIQQEGSLSLVIRDLNHC